MAGRIEDYALIGDTRTAALVCADGEIDWLCLPRFDSPAVFASLLGDHENGTWEMGPVDDVVRSHRNYASGTMVLHTTLETKSGAVRLIDFMPPTSSPGRADLVRIVEGISGTVEMQSDLCMRFSYGRTVPWVQRTDRGLRAIAGPNVIDVLSPVAMEGRDFHSVGRFTVRPGDRLPFALTWYPSRSPEPEPCEPEMALAETMAWWSDWAPKKPLGGKWAAAVERSMLTLKALTHRETGGIVAAATTSLPESIGGARNWDYRYCWIRDATFTLYAFYLAGLKDELEQWRSWLLRAIAGRPSQLQVMFGLDGERLLPEFELDWLAGYEGSRPVRAGNGAAGQLQLDVFGEICDALHFSRHAGIGADGDSWEVERALLDHLDQAWREPDEGIWEVRGPRRHFTHSKVMSWVAFDRAVKAVERSGYDGPVDSWKATRRDIKKEILGQAFDADLGSFVQSYGSKQLDASSLLIPLVGFLPATDERMTGTVAAIEGGLMRDGFVYRYQPEHGVDGLEGDEGSFLACTFWYIDNLALAGRKAEAEEAFERVLAIRNDVGLLAEQYDPVAKRQLGNFPQAFSHVGLVNAAVNLAPGPHGIREKNNPEKGIS